MPARGTMERRAEGAAPETLAAETGARRAIIFAGLGKARKEGTQKLHRRYLYRFCSLLASVRFIYRVPLVRRVVGEPVAMATS